MKPTEDRARREFEELHADLMESMADFRPGKAKGRVGYPILTLYYEPGLNWGFRQEFDGIGKGGFYLFLNLLMTTQAWAKVIRRHRRWIKETPGDPALLADLLFFICAGAIRVRMDKAQHYVPSYQYYGLVDQLLKPEVSAATRCWEGSSEVGCLLKAALGHLLTVFYDEGIVRQARAKAQERGLGNQFEMEVFSPVEERRAEADRDETRADAEGRSNATP